MKKRNTKGIHPGFEYAQLAAAVLGTDDLSDIALFTTRSVTLLIGMAYIEILENRGAATAESFLRSTMECIAGTVNRIRA